MGRDLLICVALPAVLLIGAKGIAQRADAAPQTQTTSDSQIATAVRDKFQASDTLRPLHLGVGVQDGTVTLTGTAPTVALRQQAAATVQSVPGIQAIINQIAVGSASATSQPAEAGPGTPPPPEDANEGNSMPSAQGQNAPPSQDCRQSSPPPPPYSGQGTAPMLTVPAGTPVTVMMLRTIDSKHTKPGQMFRAVVVRNVVLLDGVIAIPRGAYVEGTVIDSRGPGHLKGRPHLALQLDHLQIANDAYAVTSYVWASRGPGKGGETASTVGGTAVAGAVIGGIVGGGPTALLGGILGGLGGAGISAASRGPQLLVPAESVLTFSLNAPAVVREPSGNEIRSLAGNVPYTNDRRRGYPYPPPGYPPSGYPPPGPPGGYPY